jgi:hypothetical protein
LGQSPGICLELLNARTLKPLAKPVFVNDQCLGNPIGSLSYTPDGKEIVLGFVNTSDQSEGDYGVLIFNASTLVKQEELGPVVGYSGGASISPNGKLVAMATAQKLYLWDLTKAHNASHHH